MKTDKTIILDLTDCPFTAEFHKRIKKAFDFPDYYGENWSAFWDLLSTECIAEELIIVGEGTLIKEFEPTIKKLHEILLRYVKLREKDSKIYDDIKPFTFRIER